MTKRGLAWVLGAAVGVVASTARADDGVCTQPRRDSAGPFFGSGKGYTAQVVIADASAMTTSALVISVAFAASPNNTLTNLTPFAVATVPFVLTGPVMHFAHARPLFGVISLLGWASVAATAEGLGAALAMSSSAAACQGCSSGSNNTVRGGMVALGISVGGGALMTVLDGWMARSVHGSPSKPATSLVPTIWTTAGGGGAGVAGVF